MVALLSKIKEAKKKNTLQILSHSHSHKQKRDDILLFSILNKILREKEDALWTN